MKKIFKGKAGTAVILVFTLILAGIAIFTAVRLYQLRQEAVAPNVPSSIPQAAENACSLSFTLSGRQNMCKSASISKTNPAVDEDITFSSAVKDGMIVNTFTYAVYNLDNLYGPNNPKPVCVSSGGDVTTQQDTCPAGTYHLIFKDTASATRTTGTRTVKYENLFVTDLNNNKPLVHAQILSYFQLDSNPISLPIPECIVFANVAGTPTTTPTPTPNPSGTPNTCNGTCGSNSNCVSDRTCYQGFCRNPSCVTSQNCVCAPTSPPVSTPTVPTPTPPTLPQSGTSWPTILGAGMGTLIILGAILLAL